MFNSKQAAQYSSFSSDSLEGTSPCVFEGFPKEIFEISGEDNQVVSNLENEIEKLRQGNFDLKKNVKLQKHYKEITEEYYEEASKLTKEKQVLEGKVKGLEAELQRKTGKLIENDKNIEQLKQEVEISLLETQNKNDVIKNLNDQLKDAKDEIQLVDKINEELQQKLNLAEAKLNRVRKESTALIDSIKNLQGDYENQILEKEMELNDIRNQFYISSSDYKELFAEFSELRKENEGLKQKNFYISNEVSLADEINKENVREEIAKPQFIPEVETRHTNDNDDQESTRLYEGVENNQYYQTSEDKNLESTDFEIGVWNGTDSESDDDDNVSPCPDYDESFGRRYSQLSYGETTVHLEKDTFFLIRQEDSFSLAKVKLNIREREKYESIWQKIDNIYDYLDILGYSSSEEDYEECEKELDKVISEALEQGIMFTFPYKSDISLIDRIADTFQKLYLSADTTRIYEFLHKKKIFQIISEGASLNEFSNKEHEDFVNVICSDRDALDKRNANLSNLKELALESTINKSKQINEYDFELEIDNGYFYIDYPQNSTIEVAKIFNNEKAKDLNLNIGIVQVDKSIIRVENIRGMRNYTDISRGSIEMSFTTKVGEISIYLYPSEEDSNKIEVRLTDQVRFSKLENKSNLGQDCLLGGKSVLAAIENGYFERNSSVFKELGKTIKQSDCTMGNPSSFVEEVNRNQLLKVNARACGREL
ncbi:GumC domain-containing protein [Wolbachia endosymbiont (group A) of Philonthus cognatus]|uniref:hypothetical protein n=1 Tax=Wolbachia endosymbiont (group A) of Philonthus cognatus TaxID=2954046 RepID=UPI00222E46E4|nr:hypothetical protein [Wolbachia endosymbiont (group A) of Philonthus cognatus]